MGEKELEGRKWEKCGLAIPRTRLYPVTGHQYKVTLTLPCYKGPRPRYTDCTLLQDDNSLYYIRLCTVTGH